MVAPGTGSHHQSALLPRLSVQQMRTPKEIEAHSACQCISLYSQRCIKDAVSSMAPGETPREYDVCEKQTFHSTRYRA